jgi:hypothetical protein
MERPKVSRISITKAVEAVLELPSVRKATVFQHPELTVVATKRHKGTKRDRIEVLLTIGRPNSRNRKFVKDYQKAGEPFPVRRVQLEFYKKS